MNDTPALIRRQRWRMNPVTLKELRGRMRGARAFVVLSIYLSLLSGFALTIYVLYVASLNATSYGGQIGEFGRSLFYGVLGIELFLITFIVPAFTAGAISGERERQTYDLLRTTLITPRALVVGKLISALAYVLLLLLAAIPLQSLAFLFGGVGLEEVGLSFVVLLVTAVFIGTLGLYCSATRRRTLSASVIAYGAALFITIVLPIIALIVLALLAPFALGLSNGSPSLAVQAALIYGGGLLTCISPLTAGFVSQALLSGQGVLGYFTQTLSANGSSITLPLLSPWIVFSVLYLTLAALLLRRTIQCVGRIDSNNDALTYATKSSEKGERSP